jgi:hypothetical protein
MLRYIGGWVVAEATSPAFTIAFLQRPKCVFAGSTLTTHQSLERSAIAHPLSASLFPPALQFFTLTPPPRW